MQTPAEFARYLGIGRRTFQTWRAAGILPAPDLQYGKVLRWRMETITAWVVASKENLRIRAEMY